MYDAKENINQDKEAIMRNVSKSTTKEPKGSAKQFAFLKYYLSEQIEGQPNPCFGNAYRSATKVGYSRSYAKKILSLSRKQNSENSLVRVVSEQIRKGLPRAIEEAGIGSDYVASLLKRLGDKNDKKMYRGRLIDTGDPDSHAARVALENVAKLLGLYEPDKFDINQFSNFSDADIEAELSGIISEVSEGLAVIKRSQKKGGK